MVGCLAFVSLIGCGGTPAGYPDTAPVTGTITLDGAPLEGATISFAPAEGRSSSGKADAQGKYELRYTGAIKGAMLGTHRVEIRKSVPDTNYKPSKAELDLLKMTAEVEQTEVAEFVPPMIESLPERYRGKDSELSAEVKDADNVFDFDLTSK